LGFRFDEQGSAGAQHVFGDAAAEPAGCRGRVDLVDVIWKGEQFRRFVVERDVDIFRGHQLADDLVDGGEQFVESRRAHRHLGDAIRRRLQLIRPRLRVTALPDVESSEHCGTEPMQVVFDDVIRGPCLQILYGGLVSQPAGHDDDGGPRRVLLRDSSASAAPNAAANGRSG